MSEQVNIKAIEIINFKKVSELLTGKNFNLRADRSFGKHKDKVEDLIGLIEVWIDDLKNESEESVPKWEQDLIQKKSTASGKVENEVLRAESIVIERINTEPEKKKVDMDALRAIANGEGVKSDLFAKKKPSYDDLYDFEDVKSLPDIDNQVAIDSKGISLYDRYDVGIFYVKWDGKYLRFDDKAEFDRFAKDNSIK
jgi:hypothetical protein